MEKTKKILIGIATYVLFTLLFTIINWFFISPTFAAKQVAPLLSSGLEILVIYLITSFFFKKRPDSLIPIVIGILGSFLLEIPSLIDSISLFNTQRDLATAIVNQPFTLDSIPNGYFVSDYFLKNTTMLSTIYEWALLSKIPAILINGIFLVGYKMAFIKNLKWAKTLSYLLVRYIPVFFLILLQFLLRIGIPDGSSNDYAVINLLVIFFAGFIYLIVRLVKRIARKNK